MNHDKKDIDEILKKAEELGKLMTRIDELLQGIAYHDRISLMSTALMKTIVQHHPTSIEVIADMGNIFATMITSYRLMNEMEDDDDDDEEENGLRQ